MKNWSDAKSTKKQLILTGEENLAISLIDLHICSTSVVTQPYGEEPKDYDQSKSVVTLIDSELKTYLKQDSSRCLPSPEDT